MLSSLVRDLTPDSLGDRRKLLVLVIVVEALLSIGFVISALVVADSANAGFDVVLTALVTTAFVGGSFYVMRQSTSPIGIGFIIGSSFTMSMLSLSTGVYWSKFTHCEKIPPFVVVSQYSCDNRRAYSSVSAFAVMLFMFEFVFACLAYSWRTDLIDETGRYNDIEDTGVNASGNLPTFNPYASKGGLHQYGQIGERSAEL